VLQRLAAEGLGSLLLAATVIGSGIMAAQLSAHNAARSHSLRTPLRQRQYSLLINLLGPISGAHFNLAVSVVQALRGEMKWRSASAYAITQIVGCCVGHFWHTECSACLCSKLQPMCEQDSLNGCQKPWRLVGSC
jgi:glycerol uptake facilitator-like aquaporin